jgi:hypothetical protein
VLELLPIGSKQKVFANILLKDKKENFDVKTLKVLCGGNLKSEDKRKRKSLI